MFVEVARMKHEAQLVRIQTKLQAGKEKIKFHELRRQFLLYRWSVSINTQQWNCLVKEIKYICITKKHWKVRCTSFPRLIRLHSHHNMSIPWHCFCWLFPSTVKLSTAFLKKQRLKYSNILFHWFKPSRNTLKLSILWMTGSSISYQE